MTAAKPANSVADLRGGPSMYYVGPTTVFASRRDPRFSYCLYIPEEAPLDDETAILVAVHGTDRNFINYRNYFTEFGRWKNCVVIAPLFPVGVSGDDNRDGYKYLVEGDIHYDQILLSIVDEVAERYGVRDRNFALWGFSGGGHFTNRFLLRHPERLWAASVGSPGSVTMIDDRYDWWAGTRDYEEKFGHPLNLDALRKVSVQMVVGKADLETWEITHKETSRNWVEGANAAGATRPERMQSLHDSFEKAGIPVELVLVPNMAHLSQPSAHIAASFFGRQLDKRRKTGA